MSQVRTRTPRPQRRMGTEVHEDSRTQRQRDRGAAKRAALTAELDELLDDLDGLLEENAETFVDQYVQKGGE